MPKSKCQIKLKTKMSTPQRVFLSLSKGSEFLESSRLKALAFRKLSFTQP